MQGGTKRWDFKGRVRILTTWMRKYMCGRKKGAERRTESSRELVVAIISRNKRRFHRGSDT